MIFGSVISLILALAAGFAAGFLRGSTGYGSALVLAPVLSMIIGPVDTVAITLILGLPASLQLLPKYRQHVDGRSVALILISGFAFAIPGVWLLLVVDELIMRRIIAFVVFAVSGLMLWRPHYNSGPGIVYPICAGGLGGLIMGATSMGGPPVVLYLLSRRGTALQKKANIIVVIGGIELAALIALFVAGQVNTETFLRSAALLPMFVIGIVIGEHLFKGKLASRYQQFTLGTLLLVAIAMFAATFS